MLQIKKIASNRYLVLLSLLSLMILASVIRYGLRTYQIPTWDEQHYMRMATEFYRLLQHPTFSTPYEMLQVVPFRQPGYPLLIVPFYFLFGLSKAYFWAQVTNGILYVISIFGIYFLAKIYLSRLASFLAAILFALYGWTLLHLHLAYSETAVSAFCILTLLFLLRSDFFQKRKESYLFGLFLGLGMLMKWMTLVYVFGALLYVGYHFIKKRLFLKKSVLITIGVSFLITILVAWYPYYTNFPWYFENWANHQQGSVLWQIAGEDERNPLSLYSLTYYLNTFAQLGVIYFLLFLVGFVFAWRKKSNVKPILFVFIVGYLFSVYALLKAERHIVPIFPYVAIISASVFDYLKISFRKIVLIIFLIFLSFLSFLGSVWGKGIMRQSLVSLPLPFSIGQVNKIYLTTISRPPYIYKISGEEILEFLVKDSKENKINNPQILALFYYRPLDEPLMTYNLYNQEKPLQITNYLGTIIQNPEKDSGAFLQAALNKNDYVLVKSGKKTDDYFPEQNYTTLKALATVFDTEINISKYYETGTKIWIYQDSSTVTVLKKKKDIPEEVIAKMKEKFVKLLKK